MIEYDNGEGEVASSSEIGVKVIGVGGAGANVLDRMALEGSDDAELVTLNTDVRALSTSVSSDKIQLGTTLLKGMGTGGDPSLGRQAAIEAADEIREAVRGRGMVFVCVGLGGGTGSGAAPEVCRIAREEGCFLVAFATLPFFFEGERRMKQATDALETIGRYANAVITFDNDRMGELIVPKDGVTQAFAAADKIISQSIRATMNIVFRPGIIRIGMDDLLSALQPKDSRCLFGYGVAKGDNRSLEAIEQALKCPLLDKGKLLNDADSVLVQVAGGDSMTLYEVQLVMEEVSKHVGADTQILFGTGTDARLGNGLSVTIISSIPGSDPGVEGVSPSDEAAPVSIGMAAAEIPASPLASAVESAEAEELAPAGEPELSFAEPEEAPVEEVEPAEFESEHTMPIQPAAVEPEATEEVFEDPDAVPSAEAESAAEDPGSAIFEPLDEEESEEEAPSYAPPEPLPEVVAPRSQIEDDRNPIARAMEAGEGAVETGDDVGRVEATTDTSQKITLSRIVSSGNTGRIKTRDAAEVADGPVLPPSKPPAMPAETLEPEEPSEEAKQQQEMLQLEPVAKKKGRFAKTDPTIVDGEDLDVPTFLRKKK